MSISNSKFDAIMRKYESRREESRHTYEEHKAEVYKVIPEYAQIDDTIADLAMESAAKYLDGDKEAISIMKAEMEKLTSRQAALLVQYNYPSDYLVVKPICNDCNDTGYINDKKCHCLKQEILKVIYHQSNIEELLSRENFDELTYDYYDDADIDGMKVIIDECKRFVDDFDKEYENILLFGDVGVGKTFLSNCIAKALMDKGFSVIYFTSIRLFDTLSQYVFSRDEDDDEGIDVQSDIFTCDLLIIDDLGTETINSFVASRLFDILNERSIRRKSTVISTNLTIDKIKERYSERNFSRIFGDYIVLHPNIKDIRIRKRRQSRL